MPSNRELKKEASTLAEELGVEVDTQGLNHAKLTELVRDLKAQAETNERGSTAEPPEASGGAERSPSRSSGSSRDSAKTGSTTKETARPPINGAAADNALGGPPKPEPKPSIKRHPYQVADGRSITSKRGVLRPGSEVRAKWLHGGQDTLDRLVRLKFVVKQ